MPRTYMTTLQKSGYIASSATLAAMAKAYAEGVDASETVRGTYLRVLVAHSQKELSAPRGAPHRVSKDSMIAAVQAAHDQLYPTIVQAVTTPDIAPEEDLDDEERRYRTRERNRRTNFARTSKSTLLRWVESGGKLHTLEPQDVTKDRLAIQRAGPVPTIQRVARVEEQLQRLITQLAEEDPGAAEEAVAEMQRRMSEALGAEPERPASQPRPLTRAQRRAAAAEARAH